MTLTTKRNIQNQQVKNSPGQRPTACESRTFNVLLFVFIAFLHPVGLLSALLPFILFIPFGNEFIHSPLYILPPAAQKTGSGRRRRSLAPLF